MRNYNRILRGDQTIRDENFTGSTTPLPADTNDEAWTKT